MKSRGQKPTGALVHTAKASGFRSVSEMLGGKVSVILPTNETTSTMKEEQKCVEDLSSDKVLNGKAVSPVKAIASEKELIGDLSGKPEKENSLDGNLKGQKTSVKKSKKTKREGLTKISNGNNVDDACENKSSKRAKLSSGVSKEETKVDKNHDIVHGQTQMDGPEAWVANDFFFDPKTLVSNGFPNPCSVKEMNLNNLNGALAIGAGDNAGVVSQTGLAESLKGGKCVVNLVIEKVEEEISLPPGTEITGILDIELPPEDVGNALQFLEFCRIFGKVLDVKKGEAEAILRELVRKHNLRRGQNTLVVQFQIKLLSLILTDSGIESPSLTTSTGKNSWLKAMEDHLVADSDPVFKEFSCDWSKKGIDGYDGLGFSEKLSLLNFICDKALGTVKIRSYIQDQNEKFDEKKKKAKSKFVAAKEMKKSLKQQLQDEMAKAVMSNGDNLSIPEHDALLLKIKSEAAKAHAEMSEAKGTVPKRK